MTRLCTLILALAGAGPALAQTVDWHLSTEVVTDVGEAGATGGHFWGYHQSILVRSGDWLYAGLLDTHGPGLDARLDLFARRDGGPWRLAYSTPDSLPVHSPPNMVVDPQGRVHVLFFMNRRFHYGSFAPGQDLSHLTWEQPDALYRETYPYAGAAVNEAGEILLVLSRWENHHYYFRDASGAWTKGIAVPFPFDTNYGNDYDRHAYPFVALVGRQVHLFSTQDVQDRAKVGAGADFVYSFRDLQYYHTDAFPEHPFAATTVVDMEDVGGAVHNDDMLLDRDGRLHFLYAYRTDENDWATSGPLMHAFGPPGGPLTHVALGVAGESRLYQAPDGRIYLLNYVGNDLWGAALADDGGLLTEPAPTGLPGSRIFLVKPQANAPGVPRLDGLYEEAVGGSTVRIHAFHAEPRLAAATAVTGPADAGAAMPDRFALEAPHPNPFNGAVTLGFQLPRAQVVELTVYDLAGRRVRRLPTAGELPAGAHRMQWDGLDDGGRPAATGVYLVRLTGGGDRSGRKVLLLR